MDRYNRRILSPRTRIRRRRPTTRRRGGGSTAGHQLVCQPGIPVLQSADRGGASILHILVMAGFQESYSGRAVSPMISSITGRGTLCFRSARHGMGQGLGQGQLSSWINASTHRNRRIRELCAEFGVEVLYLPPYSPDFNLIELTFGLLKAWIKKHYCTIGREYQDFGSFLEYAILFSGASGHAEEHFRHCRVLFEEDIQRLEAELAT